MWAQTARLPRGVESHRRVFLVQAVDDALLGAQDDLPPGSRPRLEDHLARRQDLVREGDDVGRTLGVDPDLGLRVAGPGFLDVPRGEAVMDVAVPVPGDDRFPRFPGDVGGQVLVGDEEEPVDAEGVDHGRGVARRAADVALGLDLGARVDVADDRKPGVGGLPGPELAAVDHVGHGTAGFDLGQQDRLSRGQHGRRFGHEVDAAEDDRGGLEAGRLAAELEGVADEIGRVLDLRDLVVVGENDGVLLPFQLGDPGQDVHRVRPLGRAACRSGRTRRRPSW